MPTRFLPPSFLSSPLFSSASRQHIKVSFKNIIEFKDRIRTSACIKNRTEWRERGEEMVAAGRKWEGAAEELLLWMEGSFFVVERHTNSEEFK